MPAKAFLDTNILIYLFELHEPYSKQVSRVLEEYTKGGKLLATSVITVTEFLAGTNSSSLGTLHQVPNLKIIPLDESLAEKAAILQRKHKIQIGDSIHLATAIGGFHILQIDAVIAARIVVIEERAMLVVALDEPAAGSIVMRDGQQQRRAFRQRKLSLN